ncbi:MAG TPA: sensor domain-containing diguanylate cyclase, partial [Gammaproteobacteria bacterium]|nr:sensor domain-containing diguanylate cyclase [Gammaproteobacteria bacterium]
MSTINLPAVDTKGLTWLYPILSLMKNGVVLTDSASKILFVNSAYEKATGYSAAEVLGQNPGMLRSGHHDEAFYQGMWHAIKSTGKWHGEIWNRGKAGNVFPVDLSIAKIQVENEEDPYYLGVFTDILLTKAKDAEKINLGLKDLLTKLPNKAAVEEYFARTVKSLLSDNADVKDKLAVIYVDLDDFKSINKQYGYLSGDKVLREFATQLDMLLRKNDFLARLESDHFVIIMSDPPSKEELRKFALQIYDVFSRPFEIGGENIHSNCSVGVARLTDPTQ